MDEYDFSELNSTRQAYDPSVMHSIINAGRQNNLSDAQIAVLVANSMYESGHNPNAAGNIYRGLWQWNKNQMSNFKLGDIESQIAYMMQDIHRGKWPQKGDTWNGWNPKHFKVWGDPKSTIDQLNNAFELGYERRGKTDIKRRQAANIIYRIISSTR